MNDTQGTAQKRAAEDKPKAPDSPNPVVPNNRAPSPEEQAEIDRANDNQ